jgi:hypothetical protein
MSTGKFKYFNFASLDPDPNSNQGCAGEVIKVDGKNYPKNYTAQYII